MELVGTVVEVIKLVGQPARESLRYHRKFNEYIDSFNRVQADLRNRRADVEQRLQEELHLGKMPKQEVESWFKKVEEKISEAQHVEDRVRKGKYRHRSSLGKLVDKMTQAMKEVSDQGDFSGALVVDDLSTMKVKLPTSVLLVGATRTMEEVYDYLMGNEVSLIGVCGMGGIGKTTIMKDVHNRLLKEAKFQKLIWTTVSQDFDVRRLQKDIASQLKEHLSDNENTIVRAAKLSEMLRRQGRYVLILDDVWSSFSLQAVGIPEPTSDNGCKLVLTTRSEEVVRSMGYKKVQVACLPMDEALQLFLSIVGQDMLRVKSLEQTMKLIVRECDGLPLAIVTIAGCLRGISDPLLWENALTELRSYIRNIPDMEAKVFGCLKFSYDHLQKKDQSCFLYCALYPEDYKIEKEDIIEHWIEEGLIDEMESRGAMMRNGHAILQRLEENYLVERVENGLLLKMHDLVRDMALHITRQRFLVKAGMQLEELPGNEEWDEGLEKVSLMRNAIAEISQNIQLPNCQKLITLLLSNNSFKEIPESFFRHMPNLKILDLSLNYVQSLPNSVSDLEHLTALLLRECYKLEHVPNLTKLKALKKLTLERTSISTIPQGLEMLVNLRYLNLGFTLGLEEIPDGVLTKLCHLQHLILHPASSKAEEIKTLNKLEVFEGCFTDLHGLSTYAGQRRRPNKYFIWMSHKLIDKWYYNKYKSMSFDRDYSKMVSFLGFNVNPEDQIILPSEVQQLQINYFEGGGSSLNNILALKEVTSLKECTVANCNGLASIFSSCCASLQTLEVLKLGYLWNLKVIIGEAVAATPGTFSYLKVIYLRSCTKLKNLFSAKLFLQELHNLEDIEVIRCHSMEEIVAMEEEGMATDDNILISLPKLRKLTLYSLPKLKSICKIKAVLSCDSLQRIEISDCPKLERIPLHLPLLACDSSQPPHPSLKEICIYPKNWWESLEWEHPNAKNLLQPFLKFRGRTQWEKAF